jgi:hypothetical protein
VSNKIVTLLCQCQASEENSKFITNWCFVSYVHCMLFPVFYDRLPLFGKLSVSNVQNQFYTHIHTHMQWHKHCFLKTTNGKNEWLNTLILNSCKLRKTKSVNKKYLFSAEFKSIVPFILRNIFVPCVCTQHETDMST